MKLEKKYAYIILGLIIISLLITGFYWYKNHKTQKTDTVNNNLYEIKDDSVGLSFKISKDFSRIGSSELKSVNPNAIYGFAYKDATDVTCYITQTKRTKEGVVSTKYLADGTYDQIKKNYPDTALDQWEEINIIDVTAIKMAMTFSENDKKFRQIEFVGTNNQATTFAFCKTPESVFNMYEDEINSFLDTIEITGGK